MYLHIYTLILINDITKQAWDGCYSNSRDLLHDSKTEFLFEF